jgi:hypothetical protein
MEVLKRHQFMAVVNTEILPSNLPAESPRVRECWDVALLRYSSLALFTRRYPWHGLENFAFDILLGKPCLVVEHHEFFKENGLEAIRFVEALNKLNCRLEWRSLPDVIERSYKWRGAEDGVVQVKMFANKLVVENPSSNERSYNIEKPDNVDIGVAEVTKNGAVVNWKAVGGNIAFDITIPARSRALINVMSRSSDVMCVGTQSATVKAKIAVRRYLSEFRDNYVSQSKVLRRMATLAKRANL